MTRPEPPDRGRIAAVLRQLADAVDPPPPPGEPTDADVIVSFHTIDFASAPPGSPAANLRRLTALPDWPEVRQVLAARGLRLTVNGRHGPNEISALGGIRRIVEELGSAGLDAALALLRPLAGEGLIAAGKSVEGVDLTKAHKLLAAMLAGLSSSTATIGSAGNGSGGCSGVDGAEGAGMGQVRS